MLGYRATRLTTEGIKTGVHQFVMPNWPFYAFSRLYHILGQVFVKFSWHGLEGTASIAQNNILSVTPPRLLRCCSYERPPQLSQGCVVVGNLFDSFLTTLE